MARRRHSVCVLFLILCFSALLGCGTWLPERFVRPDEAYSAKEYFQNTDQLPYESFKKAVFEVPYEDVFRAASLSASQAQFNIEEERKADGLILATRTVQERPPRDAAPGNQRPHQRNYYYAIVVKEKGPKSTEVVIMAKAQGKCLADPLGSPAQCRAYAIPHWAAGHDNPTQDLGQFMTFLRNNLIAAGLL
jgi:hypothetical protein